MTSKQRWPCRDPQDIESSNFCCRDSNCSDIDCIHWHHRTHSWHYNLDISQQVGSHRCQTSRTTNKTAYIDMKCLHILCTMYPMSNLNNLTHTVHTTPSLFHSSQQDIKLGTPFGNRNTEICMNNSWLSLLHNLHNNYGRVSMPSSYCYRTIQMDIHSHMCLPSVYSKMTINSNLGTLNYYQCHNFDKVWHILEQADTPRSPCRPRMRMSF